MGVIDQALHDHFYHQPEIKKMMSKVDTDLQQEKISAYVAAQQLLARYFGTNE
jgi:hypothetical protein